MWGLTRESIRVMEGMNSLEREEHSEVKRKAEESGVEGRRRDSKRGCLNPGSVAHLPCERPRATHRSEPHWSRVLRRTCISISAIAMALRGCQVYKRGCARNALEKLPGSQQGP